MTESKKGIEKMTRQEEAMKEIPCIALSGHRQKITDGEMEEKRERSIVKREEEVEKTGVNRNC